MAIAYLQHEVVQFLSGEFESTLYAFRCVRLATRDSKLQEGILHLDDLSLQLSRWGLAIGLCRIAPMEGWLNQFPFDAQATERAQTLLRAIRDDFRYGGPPGNPYIQRSMILATPEATMLNRHNRRFHAYFNVLVRDRLDVVYGARGEHETFSDIVFSEEAQLQRLLRNLADRIDELVNLFPNVPGLLRWICYYVEAPQAEYRARELYAIVRNIDPMFAHALRRIIRHGRAGGHGRLH